MHMKKLKTLITLILVCLITACAHTGKPFPPLKLSNQVDPNKFEGEWFIIANIPYFAEKNNVATRSIYAKNPDKIFNIQKPLYDDIYVYKKKNFNAEEKQIRGEIKSLNNRHNQWKTTFYGIINFTISVLYVDPDYKFMVYGHPSRKYGWLMSATPELSKENYAFAMSIFEQNNYDVNQILKVPQFSHQLGQEGYQ